MSATETIITHLGPFCTLFVYKRHFQHLEQYGKSPIICESIVRKVLSMAYYSQDDYKLSRLDYNIPLSALSSTRHLRNCFRCCKLLFIERNDMNNIKSSSIYGWKEIWSGVKIFAFGECKTLIILRMRVLA